MTNTCRECFSEYASPVDIVTEKPALGICDFCDGDTRYVWPATAWTALFQSVVESYVPVSSAPSSPDDALHIRLQEDWELFAFEDDATGSKAKAFLDAVFQDAPDVLEQSAFVAPLVAKGHAQEWDDFAKEVTEVNRYFPKSSLDLDFLARVINENLRPISPGTKLYRARLSSTESPLSAGEMGRPPVDKARQGRANPVGIPHLYLALSEETAIYESRAEQHSYVSVATFVVNSPCQVLDIAGLHPENPFRSLDNLAQRLDSWRLLNRLGQELSRPVRSGDNQLEYIPTQYLSEYVKSLDIDGILYGSSLDVNGQNLVLFSEESVDVDPVVASFDVTSNRLQYRRL